MLRAEIRPRINDNQTDVYIWNGMSLKSRYTIDEILHDTTENKKIIIKNYEGNNSNEDNKDKNKSTDVNVNISVSK